MARLQETVGGQMLITMGKVCGGSGPLQMKGKWKLIPSLLTVSGEAAGAAAFERRLLLVVLQQLRSSARGLLDVDENTREASDPAVFIIRRRRAPRLRVAHHTHNRQQAPCHVHCAGWESQHVRGQWEQGIDMFGRLVSSLCDGGARVVWCYWDQFLIQVSHGYAPGGGDPAVRKVRKVSTLQRCALYCSIEILLRVDMFASHRFIESFCRLVSCTLTMSTSCSETTRFALWQCSYHAYVGLWLWMHINTQTPSAANILVTHKFVMLMSNCDSS